ncbi:hypothetical protein ACA910_022721 [Epithemia clementina (nom. ined.)]
MTIVGGGGNDKNNTNNGTQPPPTPPPPTGPFGGKASPSQRPPQFHRNDHHSINHHNHHSHNHHNPPKLYLPSVYRYSCQGMFSVSTDTPGSVGTCRGFRSNLEHMLDFKVSTRQDAIDQFTRQHAHEEEILMESSETPAAAATTTTDPSIGSKSPSEVVDGSQHSDAVKALLDDQQANPALVYRRGQKPKYIKHHQHNNKNKTLALASLSPTLFPSKDDNKENVNAPPDQPQEPQPSPSTSTRNHDTTENATATVVPVPSVDDDNDFFLLEENDTGGILYESWNAYGSTEVECLQLTHVQTGQTEIVAVAPYNHALVSHRHVELDNASTITCVQIGLQQKLMFLLESSTNSTTNSGNNNNKTLEDEEDGDKKGNGKDAWDPFSWFASAPPNFDEEEEEKKKKKKKPLQQPRPLSQQQQQQQAEDGQAESATTRTSWKDRIVPQSWQRVARYAYHWGIRTHAFGQKVGWHMQYNAGWLYDNSHDLAGRTVVMGQRILAFMPKTAQAWSKKVHQLVGSSNNNGNNGGNPASPWFGNGDINGNGDVGDGPTWDNTNNNNKNKNARSPPPPKTAPPEKSIVDDNSNNNNNNNNNKRGPTSTTTAASSQPSSSKPSSPTPSSSSSSKKPDSDSKKP